MYKVELSRRRLIYRLRHLTESAAPESGTFVIDRNRHLADASSLVLYYDKENWEKCGFRFDPHIVSHSLPSNMKKEIQILIVDDYAIVREGLRAFITTEPDMMVVGEAADGETAVQQCQALQPDVMVMDLAMRNDEGVEAIQSIRQSCPQTYILVLTNFVEEDRVLAALKAGAHGYILKDATTHDIVQAIRDVYRGKAVLHPSVAYVLLQALQATTETDQAALEAITGREREVLQMVAQGRTNQEIAARLGIDERTVRVHISHILQKLNLDNRTQAALFALRHGLVVLE